MKVENIKSNDKVEHVKKDMPFEGPEPTRENVPVKPAKIGKKAVALAVAALLIPISLSIAAAAYLSNLLLKTGRTKNKYSPAEFDMNYQSVSFRSKDGFRVNAWWVPGKKKHKAIILCHGFGSDKSGFLGHISFLHKAGYGLLMFDFRGHGESEQKYTSLGYLEVNDLFGAIKFLERKKIRTIGVLGISMGASTAIIAAARTKKIKAVVADSPFAKLGEVIDNYGKKFYRIPSKVVTRLTVWMAELRTGYRYERVTPNEDVKSMNTPLLIIHGKKDALVSLKSIKELYGNAKEPKELLVFNNSGHAEGHESNRFEYERKVLSFFAKYL